MAARDIMPYSSHHGSHIVVEHYPLAASQTFEPGEPVNVNASGQAAEAGSNPAGTALTGIAMAGPGSGNIDWATGNAMAAGASIPVVIPTTSTTFATTNFATDGAGTAATPTAANIGDTAGLVLASGNWFVDVGATNKVAEIVDVLDADGKSLKNSGAGTGQTVVFRITTHRAS